MPQKTLPFSLPLRSGTASFFEKITALLPDRGGSAPHDGTARRDEREEERVGASGAATRAGPPLLGEAAPTMHGWGKHTYVDGAVYEGGWKEGQRHGLGKYTYANGGVYEGEWKEGKRHGEGKHAHASGDVYEGQWKEDKRHGEGKYTYDNEDVYEGEWKKSKKHGEGKYTHANGKVYEGQWKEDKMHREGEFTFANGEVGDVYDGQVLNFSANESLSGLIEITVANRDDGSKTKHICSSDTTLGCCLRRSTQDFPHKKYFRIVHSGRSLFLSSSGKKTLQALGIKFGDEVEIGGVCPSDSNGSCDSSKDAMKVSKSKPSSKKRHTKSKGAKKKNSPSSYVVSDEKLAEQHKQEHSKSMNPVLEELGPKLKEIRHQLNRLAIQKNDPKVTRHNTKAKTAPQVASTFLFADECIAKKAGKAAYPIVVGEVANLYKTSKLSHKRSTIIDLHGCSKDEALEKLDKSLPVWMDTAMRGNNPWVLGVDIICGGGSQILSDAVKEWIRVNQQVANRPKGPI